MDRTTKDGKKTYDSTITRREREQEKDIEGDDPHKLNNRPANSSGKP